jgi:peptidoglycan/LPS O-acetylase OafA/YrhL
VAGLRSRVYRPAVERLGYRPALSSIRGVAIALVVGVHAFSFPHGGFLGVDLFFVLSGFLITTLLLEEDVGEGRISLRRFYERRARRLLPALFVLLGLYTPIAAALHQDVLLPTLGGLFYFSNFLVASDLKTTGLTHLWSLAAEEQFYVLWPPLLIFMLRRPGFRKLLAPLLGVLLVALAVHRIQLTLHGGVGISLDYRPDTRSDGIIVGCLFAVLRANGWRALLPVCRWVLLLSAPLTLMLLWSLRPGSVAVHLMLTFIVLCFGAFVTLAVEANAVARVLAVRPLIYLGRISYSLYLWHLPILAALLGLDLGFDPIWSPLAVAATIAVAVVSTHFIEEPIRRGRRRVEGGVMEPIVAESSAPIYAVT